MLAAVSIARPRPPSPSASTKASARLRPDKREAADRAHAAHQQHCAVAPSLRRSVEIATELHLEDEG